jgi:hypothetical protein
VADTGAPFFLPYPLPSDLVRDGANDIKALAEAMAQALEDIPVTQKKIEAFTGSGTWTVPAGVTYAIAYMRGGGGGIGNSSTGGDGSASSVDFASGLVSANGLKKARSTVTILAALAGGANLGEMASAVTNNDGETSSTATAPFVVAGATVTPAASISVVVGAGGTAGTSGAAGGSGYVYIEYYEEV